MREGETAEQKVFETETTGAHNKDLKPGTSYNVAWQALYCRDRTNGSAITYDGLNQKNKNFYLDETEVMVAPLKTAAKVSVDDKALACLDFQ